MQYTTRSELDWAVNDTVSRYAYPNTPPRRTRSCTSTYSCSPPRLKKIVTCLQRPVTRPGTDPAASSSSRKKPLQSFLAEQHPLSSPPSPPQSNKERKDSATSPVESILRTLRIQEASLLHFIPNNNAIQHRVNTSCRRNQWLHCSSTYDIPTFLLLHRTMLIQLRCCKSHPCKTHH